MKTRAQRLVTNMKADGPSITDRARESHPCGPPKKITARRLTSVQSDVRGKNKPNKISSRRVTFSGRDTVDWIEAVPKRRISRCKCVIYAICRENLIEN